MNASRWLVVTATLAVPCFAGLACTSGGAEDTTDSGSHSSGGTGGSGNSEAGAGDGDTGGTGGTNGGSGGSGASDGGTGGTGAGGTGTGGTGTGGGPPDGSVDAPAGCIPIAITSIVPAAINGNTTMVGYYVPESGGAEPDALWIEWFPPSGQPIAVGSYDLAQAPDNNYASCVHCLTIGEDLVSGNATKTYYPQSGTLHVDMIHDPLDGQSKGWLSNVKLVEVTLDPNTSESTPVPGGSCLYINYTSWNLVPDPVGTPCNNAEECGDPTHVICDPATATCQSWQCDDNDLCQDAADVCIAQVSNAAVGACYPACTPFVTGSGCAPGLECVNANWAQSTGFCNPRGTHAVGESCARIDLNTDCVAGAVCKNIGSDVNPDFRCVAQCDFFSTATTRACTDLDFTCFKGSVCLETTTQQVDPAGIGGLCDANAFIPCGVDSVTGIAAGICDNYFTPGSYRCYRQCRMGSNADCKGSGVCTDALWDNGLGDCK